VFTTVAVVEEPPHRETLTPLNNASFVV